MYSRRTAMGLVIAAAAYTAKTASARSSESDAIATQWAAYRSRFVSPDGRIIDTGNQDVSHSEGQGFGLIFSAHADDQAGFDRIRQWTRTVLACRPGDALHAWRFQPHAATPVADLNNATDGDLLIAFGLADAGRRWNRPELLAEAQAIWRDVLVLCSRDWAGRELLLPGVTGFQKPDGLVVNLSYLVLPSMLAASRLAPTAEQRARWQRLLQHGMALMQLARFGNWNLPPDWLHVSGKLQLRPAQEWPPRFSYDAVRIPLYLAWAGLSESEGPDRFQSYWNAFAPDDLPAWVDLQTNARSPYPASAGVRAVASCTGLTLPPGSMPSAIPSVGVDADYYSASLTLMAQIAWFERHQT